jgi:hypothetical protein
MGTRPQLIVVLGLSVGIPLTVAFRPQLVVVLGLSVGIPLTVGFRPQLVVVSGLSVGIPLTVGFRLSRSLRLSQSPFTYNSGYHGAFFANFSFSRWNFGYHGVFSWTFLSYNGISTITEPFHELFFLTMEFRLSRSLFMNFSFLRWNFGYHRAFSHDEIHDMHELGEDSFHIYHKESPLQGKEYDPPYSKEITEK